MNAFYATLSSENFTKAEALRQAQIDLITKDLQPKDDNLPAVNGSLNHPYYWASFILIGNGL